MDGGSRLILNVDDTEALRYAKTRMLRRAGFEVVEASDGRSALQFVRDLQPTLVLLDMNLPDINGIDVCQLIKQDFPGVLVLQISATYTTAEYRTQALQCGADSYLAEPVEPAELAAAVNALFRLRAAEEAARDLNASLEKLVEDRTAELREANDLLRQEIAERERAEEALRHAQKMEAVGRLTGGIAHDFNNLLTAVVGNLELLQRRLRRGPPEQLARHVEGALTAAQRGASLTQRLLAFSRRQSLAPQSVNVTALVNGMCDLVRRSAGEAVRVETALAPYLWRAHCDPNQLESAVLNLVINARDAMPGGGLLRIATENAILDAGYLAKEPEVLPGEYVMVSIADTGEGMTPETMERMFEPFFTTKPIGQGTGLGLSVLYGFVKQSSGHIRIDSEPGKGTTVRLYLPRDHEAPVDDAAAPERANLTASGCNEVVLLVEDETLVRVLLAEALRERGYEVLATAEPGAALRIIESEQPIDLLITDIGLPSMNGRQLAEAARALRPELKVLLLTGYEFNSEVDPREVGPEAELLTKPFAIDVLASAVRASLDRTSADKAPATPS